MNRNLNLKCLLFRYKDGIFVLMTGKNNTKKAFRIIIDELVAFLSPAGDDLLITESGIYKPYDDLDTCIRESYYTHVASIVEGKELKSYDKIGVYQFLIPLRNNDEMKRFTRRIIDPIIEMPEYFDTMKALTFTAGEFKSAAASLHCHHNTVRYRFQKVKEILECNNLSDIEFFGNLAMAVRLHIIYEIQNEILN